jgi:hypothetical protein
MPLNAYTLSGYRGKGIYSVTWYYNTRITIKN